MFATLDSLVEKRRTIDAMEAAWLEELRVYDRSEAWRTDGYQSPSAALVNACRFDGGVAHGHVNLARKLEKLPVVAEAFALGDISARHATVVANAFTPERSAEISNLEIELAEAAGKRTPHELRALVGYITDAIDGDGGAADDETLYQRRRYHGSTTLGGMYAFDGIGDDETGRIHRAAIKAEMQRDHHEGDTRTLGQRRYDALTNILRSVLDRGKLGTSRAVRPHITEVVHLDEYPGASAALVDLVRRERLLQGRLSHATLERIRCDCDLTRVLMFGKSEILDVGRATRTVSAAQWKALVVRDGHCQAPGCNQPPERCEAHHTKPWSAPYYGPTDLDNLQLLCWYHHRQRHTDECRARAERPPPPPTFGGGSAPSTVPEERTRNEASVRSRAREP